MFSVRLYRYHPEHDAAPRMETYEVEERFRLAMVLDVLEYLKHQDTTLTYRRSCREGVCGSDGMNINGKNGLACITPVAEALNGTDILILRPLPGMPVIRDLVVDQAQFMRQFEKIRPWLINDEPPIARERLQSPEEREKLDGLYECILCACCSSACPSWWWNPDKYIGPAGLLQAYRFLIDSRDTATSDRLADLDDPFSVFRCRQIANCTWVCPKGLNPLKAIGHIKAMLLKHGT
ncbi:succinate dehydrogenase iron-sulfur subunit [Marinobacter sp. TBZ242]|jgi:succinate dehydrogenase / fumarate reductase iron-sulfur subunit|uniref:Succinate dehydrogenase iron-sulfur subunit n=3 Tax=Gammaproteobacteria TaxID=1236 RepID=A0A6I6SLH4_9GAMM|nr:MULTISPECIES: succinate dehydrogenase iron-sulfur subunit [Gammaproteobacteria]MDX5432708.1 succinate dehydrogenase iron-sulfur subunit [Halomonas sp.]MCE8017025.1 succinate dehydrogenase iron-sulfur subunit [Halomonas sp. MCCC 1A17488]MCE8035000.1 succinate dehydrogenase iron-sulfur subunit [Halomonas sp. MCCC 1A11057]MCG3240358.1 succinate dehydrogenase iron-sulfur subunit [Halomonas sp. MCCC 1A17488]MDL0434015.1 succinate dehydrogenase iron-sulfur subunit [Marinobacter sp. TBZ242]